MFNAFLSGQIFALPQEIEISHLELARRWSGKMLVSEAFNQVCWEDLARIATAEQRPWYSPPPPTTVPVQNGIVSLGSEQGANFFAFISPLSGVSEAFKSAALAYVQERSSERSSLIDSVSLDLTAMVKDNWSILSHSIRTVEGETIDGTHLVITMPEPSNRKSALIGHLRFVNSIQIEIESHQTKVDDSFNIQVDDVSAGFDEIASSITATFAVLKQYSKVNFHETLSYN